MHLIFFNTKGGVSKSTLCEYTANILIDSGKTVSVSNTDQQDHVTIINNDNSDYYLYDTAGAFTGQNIELLKAAKDVNSKIIIPMNTGENDFKEIDFLIDNLKDLSIIDKSVFVFTKSRKNSKLTAKRKEYLTRENLTFLSWVMPMLDDFAEMKTTKRTKEEITLFINEVLK